MNVALIGPYPPPRGGVSTHIKRLEDALQDNGVKITIFNANLENTGGGRIKRKLNHLRWLFQIFTCARMDILHIHLSSWWERALIIFFGRLRGIKTVVTFHSLRDEFDKMRVWQRLCSNYVLRKADVLIAAGENVKKALVEHFDCEDKLTVFVPFIPPKRIEKNIPIILQQFIRKHRFIISANASNMNFYQGSEIYGLDMLVELCGRLRPQLDVGFVYCLTRLTDKPYLKKIRARIKELRIENAFLIVLDDTEFWPVLEKSHIFIRPTSTDSYGISVAEALTLGIPAIASDVCKRPEGTIIFRKRDHEDLYVKVCDVINNYEQHKSMVKHLEFEDCVLTMLNIYQQLVTKGEKSS